MRCRRVSYGFSHSLRRIGAARTGDHAWSIEWTDGSPVEYVNWAPTEPSGTSSDCVWLSTGSFRDGGSGLFSQLTWCRAGFGSEGCAGQHPGLCSAPPLIAFVVDLGPQTGVVSPPNAPAVSPVTLVYTPAVPRVWLAPGQPSATLLPEVDFEWWFSDDTSGVSEESFIVHTPDDLVVSTQLGVTDHFDFNRNPPKSALSTGGDIRFKTFTLQALETGSWFATTKNYSGPIRITTSAKRTGSGYMVIRLYGSDVTVGFYGGVGIAGDWIMGTSGFSLGDVHYAVPFSAGFSAEGYHEYSLELFRTGEVALAVDGVDVIRELLPRAWSAGSVGIWGGKQSSVREVCLRASCFISSCVCV